MVLSVTTILITGPGSLSTGPATQKAKYFITNIFKIFSMPAGRDDSLLTASHRLVDWDWEEGGGPSSAHNKPRMRSGHFHWIIILCAIVVLSDTWTEHLLSQSYNDNPADIGQVRLTDKSPLPQPG